MNKIPTSNIQAPEKFQASNSKLSSHEFWSLAFEVSLEVGA
jgi:hypothetical protein